MNITAERELKMGIEDCNSFNFSLVGKQITALPQHISSRVLVTLVKKRKDTAVEYEHNIFTEVCLSHFQQVSSRGLSLQLKVVFPIKNKA